MQINQIKTGIVLNYVVIALNAITGLAYTPFMLRMLGQSEYGIYSLAGSMIAYLSMLDFGFGNAVIRYTAKYRAEDNNEKQYCMFGMFTALYCGIGIITLIAGGILYYNIDSLFSAALTPTELQHTHTIIILMLFNLAFSFPLSIYGAIITAYEKFVFLRVIQIIKIIISTFTMVILLSYGHKAVAMVVVQTVFNFIALGINIIYCYNKLNIKVKFKNFDKKLFKEVSIYSFWIFLNDIINRIYWSTGQFVLGSSLGTSSVAIFSVAISITNMFWSFSTAISSVFLPKVTKLITQKVSNSEISNLFIKTGRVQFIMISFVLTLFVIFGKDFIILWAGRDYENSYALAMMFLSTLSIPLIQNLGITILQARNQMMFRSIVYVLISFLSLFFQVVLTQLYGIIGCGIAISGALVLGHGIVMNIYYHNKQNIDIKKFWKEILKMAIAPTLLSICFKIFLNIFKWNLNGLYNISILVFVYIFFYIIIIWKFSMNEYEKNLVTAPLNKLKAKTI